MTKDTVFSRTIRAIRDRPREDLPILWCNLIRYQDIGFLQGQLWTETDPAGVYRPVAALTVGQDPAELNGFWPSITAHPVERDEEARIVSFLSSRGPNDVELIVPVRNTARLMDWGRFDEAPEFPVYRNRIHPVIIGATEEIRKRREVEADNPCTACRMRAEHASRKPFDRLLDVGCGCGDLIQELQDVLRSREEEWGNCGCADLRRLLRLMPPRPLECHGIDANPDNVEEAGRRGLVSIRVGDAEDVKEPPGEPAFDILIFCGLLNRQITTREQAEEILRHSLSRLRRGGHLIITGYTSCHLTADDLSRLGLVVLQKCFPDRLFLNYKEYHLRQFYVARKDA